MDKRKFLFVTLLLRLCAPAQMVFLLDFLKRNAVVREDVAYLYFKKSYEWRDVNLKMSAKAFRFAVLLVAPALGEKANQVILQDSFTNMKFGACSAESKRDWVKLIEILKGQPMSWSMWYRLSQGLCSVGAFEASQMARSQSIILIKSDCVGIESDERYVLAKIRAHLEGLDFAAAVQILNENRQMINALRVNQLEKFIAVLAKTSIEDVGLQFDTPAGIQLRSMIYRRRIAVVGPSESSEAEGEEIDSNDVVVRVRSFGRSAIHDQETHGCRTDIVCANSQRDFNFVYGVESSEVAYLTNQNVAACPSTLNFQSLFGQSFPYGDTVTGLRAILTVLAFRPKKLKVYFFDFYSKKQFHNRHLTQLYQGKSDLYGPQPRLWRESKLKDDNMNPVHDLFGNFQLAKNLLSSELIEGTEDVKNILSKSLDEYAAGLENRLSI